MYAMPPCLNLTVLRSPDIDRAAVFYSGMGLLFTKHRHGNGPEHYASCVNGVVFELYPLGSRPPTIGTRIGFSVDDVDSIVPMLAEIGAEVITYPADSESGRRAVVKDLDGHIVELITPPNRDIVVADSSTSSGVMTKSHSSGMNPCHCDRS
jgi:catechol 2,3-dioxygenase-like lactoylglutathione lyase family enzyme